MSFRPEEITFLHGIYGDSGYSLHAGRNKTSIDINRKMNMVAGKLLHAIQANEGATFPDLMVPDPANYLEGITIRIEPKRLQRHSTVTLDQRTPPEEPQNSITADVEVVAPNIEFPGQYRRLGALSIRKVIHNTYLESAALSRPDTSDETFRADIYNNPLSLPQSREALAFVEMTNAYLDQFLAE
jgi:hypothetical protein